MKHIYFRIFIIVLLSVVTLQGKAQTITYYYYLGTVPTDESQWVTICSANSTASDKQSVVGTRGDYSGKVYLFTGKSYSDGYIRYLQVKLARSTNLTITLNFGGNDNVDIPMTFWECYSSGIAHPNSWDSEGYGYYLLHAYYKHNGVWYKLRDDMTYLNKISFTNNVINSDNNRTYYYTNPDPTIVDFLEAEGDNSGEDASYSYGAMSSIGESSSFKICDALKGEYKVTVGFPDSKDGINGYAMVINGKDTYSFPATIGEQTSSKSLDASNGLTLSGSEGYSSANFDYVLLRKTSENLSVGKYGYATYCTNVPLDFTNSTKLKAYVANYEDNSYENAKFTPITKVPANTGILLKSSNAKELLDINNDDASAEEDIPICTAGDDATKNLLVGSIDKTKIERYIEDSGGAIVSANYVLNNQLNSNSCYQTNFYRVPADGMTIRANSAYMNFKVRSGDSFNDTRAKLNMIFDDDDSVTGIDTVTTTTSSDDDSIYNLAGQKVDNDYKGIVIKNGKKYLVK